MWRGRGWGWKGRERICSLIDDRCLSSSLSFFSLVFDVCFAINELGWIEWVGLGDQSRVDGFKILDTTRKVPLRSINFFYYFALKHLVRALEGCVIVSGFVVSTRAILMPSDTSTEGVPIIFASLCFFFDSCLNFMR